MASIAIPTKIQEVSVTFVGFPSGQVEIFRTFVWELTAGTEPGMISGLRGARREDLGSNLERVVEEALDFKVVAMRAVSAYGRTPFDSGDYAVIKTADGFIVYPTSDVRMLKANHLLKRIVKQEFSFLYEGVPRKAKIQKNFPWGFRGVTAKGLRNFRWDKMAVPPQDTPRPAMTIRVKCESAAGSGKLYLRVKDAYEGHEHFESPSFLREVILFKNQQIISPEAILRRQNHETPPGA